MYKDMAKMFDKIAPTYDFINHFMSLGFDHHWRKKSVALLDSITSGVVVDVAAGTGDLYYHLNKKEENLTYILSDVSKEMLKIARKKYSDKVHYLISDASEIPLSNNSTNIVMTAFGIRNFYDPDLFLKESLRILKPGGEILILEFGRIDNNILGNLFDFFLNSFVPIIGGKFSKNKKSYDYLMKSIKEFPENFPLDKKLVEHGFKMRKKEKFHFGLVRSYIARKV
jgi:demethylmenaquinone methyltransferase/2-methoxy-6-polyprenyl-1,4-benzoquinol methylase